MRSYPLRTCAFFALIGLGALILLAATPTANGQDSPPDQILAIVAGEAITARDVSLALTSRRNTFAQFPPEERPRRALERLVAERVLDHRYSEATGGLTPRVLELLRSGRRQIILDLYVQGRFTPEPPTEAQIEQFIQDNSQLFAERKTYQYQVLTVTLDESETREQVEAMLSQAAADANFDAAQLNQLAESLAATGAKPELANFWRASEDIAEDDRAQLDAMIDAESSGQIVENEAGRLRLWVLYDVTATPTDPALVEAQIRQRLINQQLESHRLAIINDLATPAINRQARRASTASAASSAPPTPAPVLDNRLIALLTAIGAATTLSLAMLAGWIAINLRKHPLLKSLMGEDLPTSRHPAIAFLIATPIAALAIGNLLQASLTGWRNLANGSSGLAMLLAGAVLGIVMGILALRELRRRDESMNDDPTQAILNRQVKPLLLIIAIATVTHLGAAATMRVLLGGNG